jgi:hypothetical protein
MRDERAGYGALLPRAWIGEADRIPAVTAGPVFHPTTVTTDLTIIQMNDTHGYLDLHPELFWEGQGAVYRPAGGYARIATVKSCRAI